MLVTSTAELHAALSRAEAGPIIELAPGEYRGLFTITRSVTLRGQGRKTVLWRKAGPVIHVRSAMVRLEDLLIERTVLASGPLIARSGPCEVVYESGHLPSGAHGYTVMSIPTEGDELINLGELIPGVSLNLPIRLEVSARTEIMPTGVYGAEIMPSVIDPGEHTVLLMLNGATLQRNEVLLGELTLRQGQTTRQLWVSGHVLESPPPEKSLCLTSRKIALYPAADGLSLNERLFSALGLGNLPKGQHAILGGDSASIYIYLPGTPPVPIKVNGKPLAPRARCLLAESDAIQIGDISLSVQPAEPPPLELETPAIRFPDFGFMFPEPETLTVRTLKNGWRGQVISTVPWLTVAPEGFLRLPPARSHSWSVALNAESLALPDGDYLIPGGLIVFSGNHVQSVDVRIKVQRPPVALQINPINAGQIEYGYHEDRTLTVAIANLGRGDWIGEIQSNVPWLEVVSQMPLSGGPWSEAIATVRFAPIWEGLSQGTQTIPDALNAIIFNEHGRPDPEYPPQPIAVELEVTPPRGHLVIETPLIDLGEIERNTPLPHAEIALRNVGAAPWTGAIRAAQGWVQAQPDTIDLAPGASLTMHVDLLDIPEDLTLDEAVEIDLLQFEAQGDSASVSQQISVRLKLVQLPPYLVAQPVGFRPFVRGDQPPDAILYVYNMGPNNWEGKVTTTLPWLSTPDTIVSSEPGTTIGVPLVLTPRAAEVLRTGVSRFENAITITGGRAPAHASVQIDIRDTPNGLILETPTLNFGRVDGNIQAAAPDSVRILNAGTVTWIGQAHLNVPWLSFESLERTMLLEIPRASMAEFKIMVNDALLSLPPGMLIEENALTISGQGQGFPIRAQVLTQEAIPWLSASPGEIVLNDGRAKTLTLRNDGTRRWQIQIVAVPWLEVTPPDATLNAGQSQPVMVRYRESFGADEVGVPLNDPRAIVIVGPGREVDVAVTVTASLLKTIRKEKEKAAREAETLRRQKEEQEQARLKALRDQQEAEKAAKAEKPAPAAEPTRPAQPTASTVPMPDPTPPPPPIVSAAPPADAPKPDPKPPSPGTEA